MTAWLTDRWGADVDDTDPATVARLLDSLVDDADADEHGSVSVADEDGWNLEFYRDHVLFENVERETQERVGTLSDVSRDDRLRLARLLIDGDLDTLREQGWQSEG